jgi:mannose-6-phosphate isomerase-like protein (cupin superfamily)
MQKIFELESLVRELGNKDTYFLEFLNSKSIISGIIRLLPGENDDQEPHQLDELYYVIDGDGYIEINRENHPIKKGDIIFIPATVHHKFLKNKNILTVLYVFTTRSSK